MNIIDCPSPNYDGRDDQAIDMLVLHYTGMRTADDARDRLCNPNHAKKVSAHYFVDEDGSTYRLVEESNRAWHAGVSSWCGNTNINQRSIGIEIVNPGHEYGYRPFPDVQMMAVAELCREIIACHDIDARDVVGHSDVAPARKEDPGELFDWPFLAQWGVGIWPRVDPKNISADQNFDPSEVHELLEEYGYDTTDIAKTITAFQRHFRPKLLSGIWDMECDAILKTLLDEAD